MTGKLARILGLVGGASTVLPYIFTIFSCFYTLALPDNEVHFESKGYASAFLLFSGISALLAAAGFIGSFFVRKKHIFSGVIMTVSGGILFVTGMPLAALGTGILMNVVRYILYISPLLLIAAGVLSLVYRPGITSRSEPKFDEPPG